MSNDTIHARIIELHLSVHALGLTECDEDSLECRELLAQYRAGKKELSELRNQMSKRFGAIFKLTRDPRELKEERDPLRRLEHAELWRDANRQAVLVCHLFDYKPLLLEVDRDSLQSFAVSRGWTVSFPDFVSWWHPNWTSLVAYTMRPERPAIKAVPSSRREFERPAKPIKVPQRKR